jgi:hypothetical protein
MLAVSDMGRVIRWTGFGAFVSRPKLDDPVNHQGGFYAFALHPGAETQAGGAF